MPSSTIENYVKEIFLLTQREGPQRVAMGSIAKALNVTPGTATSMVKSLASKGLVHYESRVGVQLSESGQRLALQIIRKHRLVEYFLVEKLGLDWSDIHREAELLEHAVSDRVLEALDAFLGRPRFDPHGDPIPNASGQMVQRPIVPLLQCAEGDLVRIAKIEDREPDFLQFAESSGLKPGALLRVTAVIEAAEIVEFVYEQDADQRVNLAFAASAKIWVYRPAYGS